MMRPGDQQEPNQSLSLFKAIMLAIFLAIVCAVLSTSLPLSFAQGDLQVTFIDVGQGDAAWIRTPDGLDILIDGGKESQGQGLVSYLQGQGVTDIEVMVLTHPHADHVGGLVTVLQSMDVDAAVTNCQDHTSDVYQTFKDLLATKAIPTVCAQDGDSLAWSSYISATVVNPPEPLMSGTGSDLNNNSIVLRISLGSVDFLFTGDIEEEAETAILARDPNLEAEVLKVAHHGSDTSSDPSFLSQVDPEFAIISVGPNAWGHPSVDVIQQLEDAGATVCRTDEDGTIVATTDGTTYSVQCGISYSYTYLPLVLKAWPSPPTPTPTPTSIPMPTHTPGTVIVYDRYGNLRDLNWAWEKYGVWIEEGSPGLDGSVFRIVELREQSGPANIDVWVLGEGGWPMPGVTVRKSWPDGEVEQVTDLEGRTGFAMGGGDKHPEGTSGPLSFEVVAGSPSDIGRGFGWLGGTNHDHLNIVFRLVR